MIHVNVWQNPLQYCKVTSLQLKYINFEKKTERNQPDGWSLVCCHFSLVAFNILSLSLIFCEFDYYVSWCVIPLVYPAWDSLCFLDLVISLPMLGKFSAIISSNIFLGLLSLSCLFLGPLSCKGSCF